MIKRTIKYVDPATKIEKEEDFYFHFTKMELIRLNNEHRDLRGEMEKVTSGEASNKEITNLFEEFVSKSYGERTLDGRFIKSPEITQAFLVSEPYSNLVTSWFEGAKGAEDAADFLNALMPEDLVARAEANEAVEQDQPSPERIAELKARLAPPVIDAEVVED